MSEQTSERDINWRRDIRHLIYIQLQFEWRGDTDLPWADMAPLVDRGWLTEGDDNGEYDLTNDGQAAIDAAVGAAVA